MLIPFEIFTHIQNILPFWFHSNSNKEIIFLLDKIINTLSLIIISLVPQSIQIKTMRIPIICVISDLMKNIFMFNFMFVTVVINTEIILRY